MAANMTRSELVARVKDLADVAGVSAIHTALATYRGLTTEKNYEADKRALHAAIDQLAAHQAEPPQGWQLVPIESTEEMKRAGVIRHYGAGSYDEDDPESCWSEEEQLGELYAAMIAVAPSIPSNGGAGEAL